jgi:hypothetical protein
VHFTKVAGWRDVLIDEPLLDSRERLSLAADSLERGEAVTVWVLRSFLKEHSYRNWLMAIIRERGHSGEEAELLACGTSFCSDGEP